MSNKALFADLVVDETGRVVEVAWVGQDACYVLDDGDFKRHVDAEQIDKAVMTFFKRQIAGQRDVAVRGILQMMGKDDIFSKTAVEHSLNHMDEVGDQTLPPEAREMLKSMGFQIVVDFHGEIVEIKAPEADMEL